MVTETKLHLLLLTGLMYSPPLLDFFEMKQPIKQRQWIQAFRIWDFGLRIS